MKTDGGCTYDFAAKAPKGYGGITPAASPASTRRTASDIRRAKEMAVGGYRKRCRKGKICSATCIAFNKDCLVHLPTPVQRELRRAAIAITRKQKLQPQSASDIRQGIALQQAGSSMKVAEGARKTETVDGKKVSKPRLEFDRSARNVKRAERPRTTLEENLDLIQRLPMLKGADRDEAAKRVLQLDAMNRGIRLPRNELEAMYDLLPASTRNSMQNSGKATGQWYAGKDENGNPVFKGGSSGSRERGLAVYDMWLRQGGTDAYRTRGGKIYAPQDMDVEHIKPLGKGGVDAPSNWVMIRAGLNRKRRDEELEQFINRLPKTPDEQRAFLTQTRKADTVSRLKKKVLDNVNTQNIKDQDIVNPGNMGMDSKGMRKLLGSYGKTRDWGSTSKIPQIGEGGMRLQSVAPEPLLRAINFMYKNGGNADKVAQEVKDIWNKELFGGNIAPQAALNKMMGKILPNLTDDQKGIVQESLTEWVRKAGGKVGFSADINATASPRKMNAMEAHLAKFR